MAGYSKHYILLPANRNGLVENVPDPVIDYDIPNKLLHCVPNYLAAETTRQSFRNSVATILEHTTSWRKRIHEIWALVPGHARTYLHLMQYKVYPRQHSTRCAWRALASRYRIPRSACLAPVPPAANITAEWYTFDPVAGLTYAIPNAIPQENPIPETPPVMRVPYREIRQVPRNRRSPLTEQPTVFRGATGRR